ncbi:hypothetical protein ACHAWF_010171 [Thalassiosira exigua]
MGESDDDVESPSPAPADAADVAADAPPSAIDAPPPPPPPPPVTPPTPSKVKTTPEPPRWRFVNEAKKSSGYGSLCAGSFVAGRSSQELGAKYVAPDVSLYKPKEERPDVGQALYALPRSKSLPAKDDVDVGKLDAVGPAGSDVASSQREVGKLGPSATSDEVREYAGGFGGVPRRSASDGSRAPFKAWGVNLEVTPEKPREGEWFDGEFPGPYVPPGDDPASGTSREVGKLKFHDQGGADDVFVGEFARSKNRSVEDGGADGSEENNDGYIDDKGDDGAAEEEAQPVGEDSFMSDDRGLSAPEVENAEGSSASIEPAEEERNKRKRKYLCPLLLLPILAIILGIVFGKRDGKGADGGAPVGVIFPIVIESGGPSSQPSIDASFEPSASPTRECPVGTTAFTIEHVHQVGSESRVSLTVQDACSGAFVSRCPPCSVGPSLSEAHHVSEEARRRDPWTRHRSLDRASPQLQQCLPSVDEYVFDVRPAENASDACCGFDPATSVVSYGDAIVHVVDEAGDASDRTYFGEREVPCPSEAPSYAPTSEPTSLPSSAPSPTPSYDPTSAPSLSPSSSPSTSPPTQSPLVFLGGCPEPFLALTGYSVGARVESNGVIYECLSDACPIHMPGLDSSSSWRQV